MPPAAPRWHEVLSREEVQQLLALDDRRALASLALNWGLVFGSMALVARWPNPLSVVVALAVIGGRQLGLAVLMHEAAHRSLFRNARWNDWAGNWLAAYPVWAALETYRGYHLRHHAHNWTERDPDVGLARPFPVTRASFWRKVWRDLSGRTGLKFARFALRRDLGIGLGRARTAEEVAAGRARLRGMLLCNGALLGLLTLAGAPALYLLWVGAWLTTHTLVTRIRSIAEHSMVPDPADPLRNTRTTRARWWERLLVAPLRVNFHLEHHLIMSVPHYNLPRFHRLLRERGALDGALVADGYLAVLRAAASRPA